MQPAPAAKPDESFLEFEKKRRAVDQAPVPWLNTEVPKEVARLQGTNPKAEALDSTDAEFLYLYGRALLLSGDSVTAVEAFDRSIGHADANPTIRKEATLALAAATLRSPKDQIRATKHFDDMVPKPTSPAPR